MTPIAGSLPMYVFHEDQVVELPEGCDLLGSTENCKIASFAKGDHIFTTQAHPEFTHEFMACVLGFTEKKMPTDDVKRARLSMELKQQGELFGAWSTKFFKQGKNDAG